MRTFVVASLFLGLVSSFAVGTFAAAEHSPVGTWAVAMTGSDRGITYLTFSTNFTWTGYGISLESFGPLAIDGAWHFDNKGGVSGIYTQSLPDDIVDGFIQVKLPGGDKLHGLAITTNGRLHLKGTPAETTHDVSGSWVAQGKSHEGRFFASYTLTVVTNMPGWFDLAGLVSTASGTSTVSGAVIVNSDRRANGYIIGDYTSSVTTTSSFSGRFSPLLTKVKFTGKDDNNHLLVIHATKQ